jgi:uncharacterized protein (TIGR03000 family)
MARSARPLGLGLLAGLVLLVVAGTSEAQFRGFRGRVRGRPVVSTNHMPGWDWWRIYPWSPYNYGRNPYNPIIYPYVEPYPVYYPYPMPYGYGAPDYSYSYDQGVPVPETYTNPTVLVPDPTGRGTVPPPDAAVIRLLIPDRFGDVWFDGVKTSSIGTARYYVTPDLPGDKALSYAVTARFNRDGQSVSEERKVRVAPGQTVTVDFTRPQNAK